MDNIFNNGSWEIENNKSSLKIGDIVSSKLKAEEITLKYIKGIFFDQVIRIDIEYSGSFNLLVNDHKESFSSEKLTNVTVKIDN